VTDTHWLAALLFVNVYAWYALAPVALNTPGLAFGAAHVETTENRLRRPVCEPPVEVNPVPVGGADPIVPAIEAPGTFPVGTVTLKTCGLSPPAKETDRENVIAVPHGTPGPTPKAKGVAPFVALAPAASVP
jgi:hypothetical protein